MLIQATIKMEADWDMSFVLTDITDNLRIIPKLHSQLMPQHICYSHWANGARNGVISIEQWDLFNHEKGAIWQSHLAAQKEGVVATIIFSNHKTY